MRLVLLTGPLPPGARSASPATSRSRCARASVRRRPARWTWSWPAVPRAAAPSRT